MPRHFMISSAGNQGKDLFRESDHNAARDGEHTVGALGGVVALEGQANLQDAVPQQDQANGANQGKDEVGQIVDYTQGITAGGGKSGGNGRSQGEGQADAQGVQPLGASLELILLQIVHVQIPPF